MQEVEVTSIFQFKFQDGKETALFFVRGNESVTFYTQYTDGAIKKELFGYNKACRYVVENHRNLVNRG